MKIKENILFILIISALAIFAVSGCAQPKEKDTAGITEGDTSWHVVAATDLLNGWTFVSGATAAYRKDGFGVVHLKGRLNGGTLGYTMFYLPTGYMPQNQQYIGNSSAYVSIGTNGAVFSNVTPAYLDGISFYAYQP